MSRYVRTVKTASGATAVQVAYKHGREVIKIDHIGSAHNDAELEFLIALANKRLNAGQLEMGLFAEETADICVMAT